MNVPNFPVSRTFAEAVGVCELVDVLISLPELSRKP